MNIKIKLNFFSHNKLKFQPRTQKVTVTFSCN